LIFRGQPLFRFSPHGLAVASFAFLLIVVTISGQNPQPSLQVVSRDGRRTLPITVLGGQELVALDDLAAMFRLTVREERDAITVSYQGRTIVLTPDQTMVSVSGRLVSLAAPLTRSGTHWLVPLDFISRALLPVYDARLELRRPSRLLLVGDLRAPRVTVRDEVAGNVTRLTIDTQPRATAVVAQDGPERLSVRIDADILDLSLPATLQAGLIQAIRAVDATTLMIDLAPAYRSFRSSAQAVDAANRLTIELLPAQADPAPPVSTGRVEPASPSELPFPTPTAASVRTMVIDAGHGGDDTGAKGAGGALEKDITLAVARRLEAAVSSRLGVRVIMTRTDDRMVAVTDRTALANNNKADLMVSLHVNASFREETSGLSVYVASFDPTAAAAEGLRAPQRLPALGGGLRDIELVPWSLAQIRHRDESLAFANALLESLGPRVPLMSTPVQHAPLRVLESANMAAVVVEMGYVTNSAQETQLTKGDFQNLLVAGILDAVVRQRDGIHAEDGR
jgi:N-acetylmuramoyl-L-alanine amidase